MRPFFLSLALLPSVLSANPTISAGQNYTLAIDKEGTAYGLGCNDYGQLGIPARVNTPVPTILRKGIKAVAAGELHTLLLDANGNVFATGVNEDGRLGLGQIYQAFTPMLVLSGVKAIATGARHSMFLKTDGTAWTCGADSSGELGDGGMDNRQLTPVKVMSRVRAISAGDYHSMFLLTDGSVWAAGGNQTGQLGNGQGGQLEDGSEVREDAPVHIMDDVKAISAGTFHSLFLKNDGSVWACGANYHGQFGPTKNEWIKTPVKVMTGVTAIAAGDERSFYLKSDGGLWCAGENWFGQLGDGNNLDRFPALQVLSNVAEVSAGRSHTIVRKKDGTIWTTGDNDDGQLGDGTFNESHSFTEVLAFSNTKRPEIVVLQAGASLSDGISHKSFGSMRAGKKGITRTFVITNPGNSPLTGLSVKTKGADAKDFIVTPPASDTVKPGKTTSFKVTFHPSKTGTKTTQLRIKSNDKDESPFDIRLTGVGSK